MSIWFVCFFLVSNSECEKIVKINIEIFFPSLCYPAGAEFQITAEHHLYTTAVAEADRKCIPLLWQQLIAKQIYRLIWWHRCNWLYPTQKRKDIKNYLTKINFNVDSKNESYLGLSLILVYKFVPKGISIHSQLKIFFVSLCINATADEEACAKQGSVQNI